jgi:hypothetical protein
MNLFALDQDPGTAAIALVDSHVVKMVLETAQILSTVHHMHNPTPPPASYRPTHTHHPCVLWAAACSENYAWAVQHGLAIAAEYTHRYGKTHKSEAVLRALLDAPPSLPSLSLQPFAQAMPDAFKSEDAIASYRRYYADAKRPLHRWTRREAPEWIDYYPAVRKRTHQPHAH